MVSGGSFAHFSSCWEKWAAGGTFLTQMCYWQKVTRRRQKEKIYWENMPPEAKGEKTTGKGHHRGAKHKIPQKRIDISLISAII